MIDSLVGILAEHGLLALTGGGAIYVGLWLRRAQAVALWLKFGSVLAILTGLGALLGVVDLARLVELLAAARELAGVVR